MLKITRIHLINVHNSASIWNIVKYYGNQSWERSQNRISK